MFEHDAAPLMGRDIARTKRLYVDGTLAAAQTGRYRPNSECPLYIGAGFANEVAYRFVGGVDQARVYFVSLSGDTISTLAVSRCDCGLGTGIAANPDICKLS